MPKTIFTNANLLTGDAHRPGATVAIEGNRITAVDDSLPASPGDVVVDLAGKTLMPGMVIGHYHATYKDVGKVPAPLGLDAPPAYQAIRAGHNLGIALDAGFTSVISAGSPFAIDASLKKAIDDGLIAGPRLVPCGNDLSSTGHCNDLSFPWYWEIGAMGGIRRCDGPEEYRKGVREEVKAGAEMIKLFVTAGHGTAGPADRDEISREELAMAIRTAHARGVMIRGHISNRNMILTALDEGIDIIDHGDGFDTACIDKILEKDGTLVPSLLFPHEFMKILPDSPYRDALKRDYDQMAAALPAINAAGVRLLLGDDHGAVGLDHGRYAEELMLYVELGIPALDVIRWATRYGAEAVGRGHELGIVGEGRLADLLVVDGDPLADISVLNQSGKLLAIVKDGAFVKAPAEWGIERG